MLALRVTRLVNDQVGRASASGADVGIGGVEVHIRRDKVPSPDERGSQDVFGGASLVGREKVFESENVIHRRFETMVGTRPGVRFVAEHHCRPLVLAHRARARIGQQVDENILGLKREDVVTGGLNGGLALGRRWQADGFDGFDAEGFGRIVGGHLVSLKFELASNFG